MAQVEKQKQNSDEIVMNDDHFEVTKCCDEYIQFMHMRYVQNKKKLQSMLSQRKCDRLKP